MMSEPVAKHSPSQVLHRHCVFDGEGDKCGLCLLLLSMVRDVKYRCYGGEKDAYMHASMRHADVYVCMCVCVCVCVCCDAVVAQRDIVVSGRF